MMEGIFKLVIGPVFVGFWFVFILSQVMMVRNRKPGVKLFEPGFFGNPLTIQFFGHKYLSERGIVWRNISWASAIGFVVALLGILSTKPLQSLQN